MYMYACCNLQGGFAISDEMCLDYIHYYPLVDLEVCKSSVMTDLLYDFRVASSLIHNVMTDKSSVMTDSQRHD